MSNPIASVLQSSNFSAMNGKTPMSNGSSKLQNLSTKNVSQDHHPYDEDLSPGNGLSKTANFDDALDNLQKIVEEERFQLKKLEEDQEVFKNIKEKNRLLASSKAPSSFTLKTNRSTAQTQMADEKRIQKLTGENKHLADQLKIINLKIDAFVKDHLKQSNSHTANLYRESLRQVGGPYVPAEEIGALLGLPGQPDQSCRQAARPARRGETATPVPRGVIREPELPGAAQRLD